MAQHLNVGGGGNGGVLGEKAVGNGTNVSSGVVVPTITVEMATPETRHRVKPKDHKDDDLPVPAIVISVEEEELQDDFQEAPATVDLAFADLQDDRSLVYEDYEPLRRLSEDLRQEADICSTPPLLNSDPGSSSTSPAKPLAGLATFLSDDASRKFSQLGPAPADSPYAIKLGNFSIVPTEHRSECKDLDQPNSQGSTTRKLPESAGTDSKRVSGSTSLAQGHPSQFASPGLTTSERLHNFDQDLGGAASLSPPTASNSRSLRFSQVAPAANDSPLTQKMGKFAITPTSGKASDAMEEQQMQLQPTTLPRPGLSEPFNQDACSHVVELPAEEPKPAKALEKDPQMLDQADVGHIAAKVETKKTSFGSISSSDNAKTNVEADVTVVDPQHHDRHPLHDQGHMVSITEAKHHVLPTSKAAQSVQSNDSRESSSSSSLLPVQQSDRNLRFSQVAPTKSCSPLTQKMGKFAITPTLTKASDAIEGRPSEVQISQASLNHTAQPKSTEAEEVSSSVAKKVSFFSGLSNDGNNKGNPEKTQNSGFVYTPHVLPSSRRFSRLPPAPANSAKAQKHGIFSVIPTASE